MLVYQIQWLHLLASFFREPLRGDFVLATPQNWALHMVKKQNMADAKYDENSMFMSDLEPFLVLSFFVKFLDYDLNIAHL